MYSYRKVLDPWKRLPSKGWLDLWKEPEIARSQVGWVWWMFHQTDTIVIKVRLFDASFLRSCIVVMELDSRPTSSPCRWLIMQKNVWQKLVLSGYVDNDRPLSTEENGEHSLSWTETCFQDLRAWFIFDQPHHVRTFIFHNKEGNPTIVTRNNIKKPLMPIWFKLLEPIAADCHPLFFLFCC